MKTQPPSKRPEFSDALILSAVYSGSPGSVGHCELAVRWNQDSVQLWEWVDALGLEKRHKWPKSATYLTMVDDVLADEAIPAAVSLHKIAIIRDRPPLGDLLAFVYADEEPNRGIAELLLQLPESVLVRLATERHGLRSRRLIDTLSGIFEKAMEHGVDIDSLDVQLQQGGGNLLERLETALRGAIARVALAEYRSRQAREQKLRPFRADIKRICERWSRGKPWGRYPGGSTAIPPAGYIRLHSYLEHYVLIHGVLPTGVHEIPGGPDGLRTSAGLTVDFDKLGDH